jgi:sugar phosphate permease
MSASSKSQPSSSNQHTSAVATWQQVAIFMAIYIGYGGYYILRKAFPSVVSFVLNDDDMTFTLQHAGALTSAMAMMYGVGKLVFGVAADNFDPLLVMFFPLLAASYVSQLHTSINQSCSIACNYADYVAIGIGIASRRLVVTTTEWPISCLGFRTRSAHC